METGQMNFVEISEINGFITYLRSIEWQDPLLICLIIFHILVTLTCLTTRNYANFQVVLFLALLLMVYFSENINEFASQHWSLFSRQQYFDSKGLFISIVFCIPLLLNCMIMVGSWLYQSTQLMINLKKAQLRELRKQKKHSQSPSTEKIIMVVSTEKVLATSHAKND